LEHLLVAPADSRALLVLAHGAGAGMRHIFLERTAQALADRRIATFRYEFAYMEKHAGRPDPPAVAAARVREAVAAAAVAAPGLSLFAGGKSFGGRMTSTAAAESPLPGVRGLVFLGFPLHPPGQPGSGRAEHLDRVTVPMLFLQGTRDTFAQLPLLEPVIARLKPRATLHLIDGGDHSFKVPKSSGRTPEDVMSDLADTIAAWTSDVKPLTSDV